MMEGTVLSFGKNVNGELGQGHFETVNKPCVIEDLNGIHISKISAGACHSLALSVNGFYIYSWGLNEYGQLGLDHYDSPICMPTRIPTSLLEGTGEHTNHFFGVVEQIVCGGYHSVVLLSSISQGRFLVFGANAHGQLGIGELYEENNNKRVCRPTWNPFLRGLKITSVACGTAHTLIHLGDQDVVYSFGANDHGQLGLGHNDDQFVPCKVKYISHQNITQIAAGYATSYFWVSGSRSDSAKSSIADEFDIDVHSTLKESMASTIGAKDDTHLADSIENELNIEESVKVGEESSLEQQYEPISLVQGLYGCGESFQLGVGDIRHQQSLINVPMRIDGIPSYVRGQIICSSFAIVLPESYQLLSRQRNLHPTLSIDMAPLLISNHYMRDMMLQAQGDGSIFAAHRCIVSTRCPAIGVLISQASAGRGAIAVGDDTVPVKIALPRLNASTVHKFLFYLYTGVVEIHDSSLSEILLLARAAFEYHALRLQCICEEEIGSLLNDDNVVLVLREAKELGLLSVKRICIQYISENYSACVSSRNKIVVEALGKTPELLAEVVGLSSKQFAQSLTAILPYLPRCPTSSIELDFHKLLESGDYSDVIIEITGDTRDDYDDPKYFAVASASLSNGNASSLSPAIPSLKRMQSSNGRIGILAHRAMLAARSPFFEDIFRAHVLLKEEGIKTDKVSSNSKARVEAVIIGTGDDGHLIVRDFNKASFTAMRAFLLHLYTDAVNHIDPEMAIDVLQLACVYGLGDGRLSFECEKVLRIYMTPQHAIETLCVAYQLHRIELQAFVLNYIVDNFVACVANESLLRDAFTDFPELAVSIMKGLSIRMQQHSQYST